MTYLQHHLWCLCSCMDAPMCVYEVFVCEFCVRQSFRKCDACRSDFDHSCIEHRVCKQSVTVELCGMVGCVVLSCHNHGVSVAVFCLQSVTLFMCPWNKVMCDVVQIVAICWFRNCWWLRARRRMNSCRSSMCAWVCMCACERVWWMIDPNSCAGDGRCNSTKSYIFTSYCRRVSVILDCSRCFHEF